MALAGGIPFIGFGFLDNSIMLLAGNEIDVFFGAKFGISSLAAAGLGNMVSDVAGIKAGALIERVAEKSGLPRPNLSPQQLRMTVVKRVSMLSGALGISIGCILGMFPLLFIETKGQELQELFNELDVDGDGRISSDELRRGLDTFVVESSEKDVDRVVASVDGYKEKHIISFEEFKALAELLEARTKQKE